MLRGIALLLVLVVTATAVILFRAAPEEAPSAELVPGPAEPEPAVQAAEPNEVLRVPNSLRESSTPAAASSESTSPPPPAAEEARPVVPPPDPRVVYFQQKYGHMQREELAAELAALETLIRTEQRALMDQRFVGGIYDVALLGGPPLPPLAPGPDGRVPVSEGRAVTDPSSGQTESRRAHLPFAEYPEFYALLEEAAWVKQLTDK